MEPGYYEQKKKILDELESLENENTKSIIKTEKDFDFIFGDDKIVDLEASRKKRRDKLENDKYLNSLFDPPHSDIGNARRLQIALGKNVLYSELEGFLFWNGGYWQAHSDKVVMKMAADFFSDLYEKARESALDKETVRFMLRSSNLNSVRNCLEFLQTFVVEERFNKNPWHLNFDNGTVDLRRGDLMAPQREHRITKTTGYDLPVGSGECSLFRKFVLDSMGGDAGKRDFLFGFLASSLSGCVDDEIILLNHGSGSNGKSTVFNLMLLVLGDYARAINVKSFLSTRTSSNLGPRPDLVDLVGVRYGTMSEPPSNAMLDESLIKQFTGGDVVCERGLYHRQMTQFRPCLHLSVSYNTEPSLKDFSYGMVRRLRKLAWNVQFPRNNQIRVDLEDEVPLIGRFLVGLCRNWSESGLCEPECVTLDTQEYFYDQNPVAQFVDQYLDVVDGLSMGNKDLWKSWQDACEEQGWECHSKRYVSKNLKVLGYKQSTSRDGRGRRWLKLSHRH